MRSRPARMLAGAVLLAATAGCGDSALWARWRAERANWQTQRLVVRVLREGAIADPRRTARARAALEALLREFPPRVWAAGAGVDTVHRDVARISGAALVSLARLDAAGGDTALALARLVEADSLRLLTAVRAEAGKARAELLEAGNHPDEALATWLALASLGPLDDDPPGETLGPTLGAPLRAAALLRAQGRAAAADSMLAAADRRWTAAVPAAKGGLPRTTLLDKLSDVRRERGDLEGALAARRRSLGESMTPDVRHRVLLRIAAAALAAGHPDSARTYAAWAAGAATGIPRAEGMEAVAAAWETSGPADSALEAWARLLAEYPRAQDFAAEARFHRGLVLETSGRWVLARTEFRTLIATQPTHPFAFDAVLRIVRHHLEAGEVDLAELEGRHAREQMDLLIATQHDEVVRSGARATRAALDSLLGEERIAGPAPNPSGK